MKAAFMSICPPASRTTFIIIKILKSSIGRSCKQQKYLSSNHVRTIKSRRPGLNIVGDSGDKTALEESSERGETGQKSMFEEDTAIVKGNWRLLPHAHIRTFNAYIDMVQS
jgi:hypothetical protein